MSNQTEYEEVLPQAQALPADAILKPYMPVGIYAQEAEDLLVWSRKDKEALLAAGIPESHFTMLEKATGGLRYAQSNWMEDLKSRQDAEQQWADEYPAALDFSKELTHTFRYAYRKDEKLLDSVSAIAEGNGAADTIQDLSDLEVLGKKNPAPLEAISFDMTKLDESGRLSAHMANLRAEANGEKFDANDSLTIRNQMYTILKLYVDDIRACGKFLFWRKEDRLRGYKSNWITKVNSKR